MGYGRKPDHPLPAACLQVFKAMKRAVGSSSTLKLIPLSCTATVADRVKCRNRRVVRGKKGREPWIYAYWGIGPSGSIGSRTPTGADSGVETSYRQMNQCRIRTTTTRFAVRFLYVAIGFLNAGTCGCGSIMRSARAHRGCRRITWLSTHIADDAALAPGGGVLDVRACKDSIV